MTEYRIVGMGIDKEIGRDGRDGPARIVVRLQVGARSKLETIELSEDAALVDAMRLIEAVRILRNDRLHLPVPALPDEHPQEENRP